MIWTILAFLTVAAWTIGSLLWLHRVSFLYDEKISRPWKADIELHFRNRSFQGMRDWNRVSEENPLLSCRFVLNPVSWIKNWNWEPEDE